MSSKNTLLLGTRKGLITYKRNPKGNWHYHKTEFLGVPVSIAAYDEVNGYWWAMLDHGHWGCKLHRSRDGQHWEEVEAPKYPEGEEISDGTPATTRYLWAFANGGNDHPGKIFIGTEPGGLFLSNDNGDSFNLVRSLWDQPTRKTNWFGGGRDYPGIHSVLVDPRDSDHIFIGISCAGVYETTDGGKSWSTKNKGLRADFLPDPNTDVGHDPHIVVMSKSNPDVMWQQNHCGIFVTENGGEKWKDVSQKEGPANFGFAIAVHDEDPNVAWVVPGDSDQVRVACEQSLCVCRTTDGGKSWYDYRAGLPQDHAFDITYRHALDVAGDEVVFGTTTGNLYWSGNGGERWESLNNNLPMVYSVAFVDVK